MGMETTSEIFFFSHNASKTDPALLELLEKENVSVFESVRSYGGIIFRLEEHLKRLFASAKTVGLKISQKPLELKRILYQVLEKSERKDAFLRLTVTSQGIFVILTSRVYPKEVFERGVRVVTSVVRKSISRAFYPEAKTSNYGSQTMATLEMPRDAFEVLFLSQEGYVREFRTSNVFMVKQNTLFTPPAVAILDGVTKKVILEIAREISFPVKEVYFTRHDLFNAEEVFLTHTSGEIIPVRDIDGRLIGKKVPGEWTQRLMKCFRKKVKKIGEEKNFVKN